jgi:hypothetical protein
MEVNHHPNVEKKSFKEYFLEFLMIFLAVTMGFFAESIRENISNHEREKEYISSYVVIPSTFTPHPDFNLGSVKFTTGPFRISLTDKSFLGLCSPFANVITDNRITDCVTST